MQTIHHPIKVVFLIPFRGLLPGLLADWQMRSPIMIVWFISYFLIMAIWEDIVFVGYIQTRIYGLIKKDIWAIFTGGLIFAAIHYPRLITLNILSGGEFGADFWLGFVVRTGFWILAHVLINSVFRPYRSIIVVTLFHASYNMAFSGGLWEYTGEGSPGALVSWGIVIGAILIITDILPYFKKRRTTNISKHQKHER